METKKIKLVAFLGNPGKMYAGNRHNAGRILADNLPFALEWQSKFKGLYAASTIAPPEKTHFLAPETYMNLSGESAAAAAAAAAYYKIQAGEILVVHDELELPLGEAAFKQGGGLGGHKGLRSIKACLGSTDFWRLRIGIGRPGGKKDPNADISGWVLSDFSAEESAVLRQVLESSAAALLQALLHGPDFLLPAWNRMRICPPCPIDSDA
jgi:PTH1 family peptidyl-tRNA hydrolase